MQRLTGWAILGLFVLGVSGRAEDGPLLPAGGPGWRPAASPPNCPPAYPVCPPGSPLYPVVPGVPLTMPSPSVPGSPLTPSPTTPNTNPMATPPTTPSPTDTSGSNPFAQATEAGGLPARTFNENFDGDNLGVFYRRTIITGYTSVPQVTGYTQQVTGTMQQSITVPGQTVTIPGQTVTSQNVTIPGQSVIARIGTTEQYTTVTIPAQTVTATVNIPGQTVTTAGTSVTTTVPKTTLVPTIVQTLVPHQQTVLLPLAGRYDGVQIVDNDSPRPMDRVSFGYNFYSSAGASLNPGVGGSDVQRQTAYFEKTFLGGDASIGMRLPFVQQYGPVGVASQTVGDLTIVFKYALINNRETGDLFSVGMAVTVPTGATGVILADGSSAPHSVLIQPWTGFVKMFDLGYVQGISNLIVPTDGQDPTVWGNSLAVGYWLYRNPSAMILTAITPIAEINVRTPLNDRNPNGLVYLQDQVNFTAGTNFHFGRAILSGAVSVPVVGPRPWNIEAMSYLSYRF